MAQIEEIKNKTKEKITTEDNNEIKNQPVGNSNNVLVWIIAFIPVIGAFFSFGSIVFFAVNAILTYIDENNLKKCGYDTSVLGNAWLIPVYLYNRSKLLNQNKAYFVIWCITFVISCL